MASRRIVDLGQRHAQLMWLAVGALTFFVTLVLLMTTEAPVVLYQAF